MPEMLLPFFAFSTPALHNANYLDVFINLFRIQNLVLM